jgi:transposase
MAYHIRSLMMKADGFEKLQGHVEADEAYIGGYQSVAERKRKGSNKTIVMGIKERGGRMVAEIIPGTTMIELHAKVIRTVKHHTGEYTRGEHHTNHVESFWRLFKNSIRSTHIHVSSKYMAFYLSEFTFRSNHRQMTNAMFDLLVAAL